MKIAILSDVHGNLPALMACLNAVRQMQCELIYCLGDTFGYYSEGQACLDALVDAGAHMMIGNHEAMLLGKLPIPPERQAVYQLEPERSCLELESRTKLEGLLPYRDVTVDSGTRLLLVHGAPWDPLRGYVYPDSPLKEFGELPYDFVFMGHTHRPFVREEGGVVVVNVGSCGLPRDIGDRACFAVYDTRLNRVDLIRTPLDCDAIRARYPNAHPSVLACLERR